MGFSHKTHGMKKDKRYRVWQNMKWRASKILSTKNPEISVCQEWSTFEGFMQWSEFDQWRSGLQIGRINQSKGFSPQNCRWVTHRENNASHAKKKLSPRKAKIILKLCESGISQHVAGSVFGVSKDTARRIVQDAIQRGS